VMAKARRTIHPHPALAKEVIIERKDGKTEMTVISGIRTPITLRLSAADVKWLRAALRNEAVLSGNSC